MPCEPLDRGFMISLKKYLDGTDDLAAVPDRAPALSKAEARELLPLSIAAYRSALMEMGNCSQSACPGLGEGLKMSLGEIEERLSAALSIETVAASEKEVREQLQDWGQRTARHYREKTDEVKEILLAMAHTAEAVGERDQRCSQQITVVTTRLKAIANLEDLTQIRASIEESAMELKTSIDRITAEGKAAIEHLQAEVSTYQTKLEEAEQIAWRDALTGVRSRLCAEGQIERSIQAGTTFCVAIVDIDGFKQVNDEYGHVAGDELLKQFATELQSACRSTDVIGRWGGDEFIILLPGSMTEAQAQSDRLREWVCGSYTLKVKSGKSESESKKLRIDASIGLAEYQPGDTLKELIERADAEMYQHKASARAQRKASKE
jgi:diguanylate cyclase